MASANLPYAQSLRAIGHSLELMSAGSFELEKRDEVYLVRVTAGEPAKKLGFGRSLLKKVIRMLQTGPDPDDELLNARRVAQPLRYTSSDICNLDTQAGSQRGKANTMPDAHKLSQVLRVIGDYLDRKEAREFTVSKSTHSVSVWYETTGGYQNRESFTVPDLYERAIHLYLQRSSREGPHA